MIEIERFVAEHQPDWKRLAQLLDESDRLPPAELGRQRLQELVLLYRTACTDLNQMRSLTANPDLLGHLNQLTGRAYRFIYRGRAARLSAREGVAFLLRGAPATFQRQARAVRIAALAFAIGVLVGFGAVVTDDGEAASLIPQEFFVSSPRARVERIEQGSERVATLHDATAFGSYLYTHNIQVSFLAFALGALTLVGGVWLLFYNGVLLGAVSADYLRDGVGTFFFAWVGPHGVLELPSIVFAGAAGLAAGRALWLSGESGRGNALRALLPDLWRMLLTCALLLVCAGLIEGSFSQMSARSVPYGVKLGVAAVLFLALWGWLFGGRVVAGGTRG